MRNWLARVEDLPAFVPFQKTPGGLTPCDGLVAYSGMPSTRSSQPQAMPSGYAIVVTGNTALIWPVPELPKYGVMTSTPAS